MRELCFVINGEEVGVGISAESTLAAARNAALAYSANTGRPVTDWDVYDEAGVILSPYKIIGDGVPDRMFLALRMASICHTVGYQDCPGHVYDVSQAKVVVGPTAKPKYDYADIIRALELELGQPPYRAALLTAMVENSVLREERTLMQGQMKTMRDTLKACSRVINDPEYPDRPVLRICIWEALDLKGPWW
jgi:hypothetical protein